MTADVPPNVPPNPVLDALGLDHEAVAGLLRDLAERGATVATAESLTAGLVCAALTSVPGSSAVVRGGLVVYATDLKAGLADVDPALLAAHGAVHPLVAEQLAVGAARRCGADYGVGLTGVAGPDPQDGVAAGVFYVAVSAGGAAVCERHEVAGDRHAVRAGAVRAALARLGATLVGGPNAG